jgi:hypothetical protein
MSGQVACIGKMTNTYTVLMRNPIGHRPLGRPKHRREDDIKMMMCKGMNWIRLVQDRDQ